VAALVRLDVNTGDGYAARLIAYLEALETAATAIDRARRLFPDPGLDHAFDRLRLQSAQYAQKLLLLEAEPGA
jgi:hypothetical protein